MCSLALASPTFPNSPPPPPTPTHPPPLLPPPIPHFPLLHNLQAKNGDPTLTLEDQVEDKAPIDQDHEGGGGEGAEKEELDRKTRS